MNFPITTFLEVISVLLLIVLFVASYVKAPPDVAYIISGLRKRTVIGRASFRIPFLERLDKVSLRLIPIDVKTSDPVPTADYININVDSVVNIKVSADPEKLKLAAQNFLNRNSDYIAAVAREVLEGNMREIVGQMHLEEMVNDRQKFADMVKTNAAPDLAAMGLEIVSFNVQNFVDNDKVIENLGIDNIVKISKAAAISRANAERDIAVAKAAAAKEANDAQVNAETEIAKRQNDLAIKRAELKRESDTQAAIAEAAKSIQAEEQRKIREVKFGDANIARQEKEIELKDRQVAIRERELEAEVKKTAEANKYATVQESDARLYATQRSADADLVTRQKEAEAKQFEAERAADALKAQAAAKQFEAERDAEARKALAEAEKVKGENEAAVIRAKGEAEAEAIRMKALAEAEGLERKADAMAKYGDAAKMDLQLQVAKAFVEQLPAISRGVAEAYSKVGSITMYGDQSAKIAGNVIDTTAQLSDSLSKGLGIDLKSLLVGAFGAKAVSAATKSEPPAPNA